MWHRYVSRALNFLGAILCSVMSVMVLWSEFSVSPILGFVGLSVADAQRGSVLLYWVCLGAKVPPSCLTQERAPYAWETPFFVTSAVQNIIILHLFYLCGVAHFALTRMKVFGLYEVVPGETGAAADAARHGGSQESGSGRLPWVN